MVESKYRVALLALIAVLGVPAHAQQPAPQPGSQQAPRPQPPPQAPGTVAPPGIPPEIAAARAAAALRRYEAGTDLETLLAEVAASSGREFLVDPRVQARVLSIPAIEDPTYPVLLSILRMHGYTAVDVGGRVNIVPDANVRSMPSRLLQRDDRSVPDDEWVTRVITVPGGGNAAQLVPILRPLLPLAAHLAAVESKLVIVDTYANVRRITELVNALAE